VRGPAERLPIEGIRTVDIRYCQDEVQPDKSRTASSAVRG
jgi:hypothetical protein